MLKGISPSFSAKKKVIKYFYRCFDFSASYVCSINIKFDFIGLKLFHSRGVSEARAGLYHKYSYKPELPSNCCTGSLTLMSLLIQSFFKPTDFYTIFRDRKIVKELDGSVTFEATFEKLTLLVHQQNF